MRALLGHAQLHGLLLADEETVAALLRATSAARFTPGCSPKDVALVQVRRRCHTCSVLTLPSQSLFLFLSRCWRRWDGIKATRGFAHPCTEELREPRFTAASQHVPWAPAARRHACMRTPAACAPRVAPRPPQVYGVCVLGELLSRHPPGHPSSHRPQQPLPVQPGTAASIAPEVHASVGAVVALLTDVAQAQQQHGGGGAPSSGGGGAPSSGGGGAASVPLPWQLEEASHEPVVADSAVVGGQPAPGGSCRLAAACRCSHEDLRNGERLSVS